MVITPLSRADLYRRAFIGLKDNMPSKSAKPRRPDLRDQASARRVAIIAFPGVTLLDISGPAQVFAELQEIELPSASYSLSYLSIAGGLVPTDVGMMIDTAPIGSVRPNQVDTLIIPGGPGIWELRQDAALMKWIVDTLPKARRVASVCLGAFVLAWTGVLDGKRAATHWRYCPRLADGFPAVRVEPNAIFVKDGRVWSSAGVSAGIDLALAMIEEDFGHTTALDIARRLVVFLKRPGGQSQFSAHLAAQIASETRVQGLQHWILDHLAADLSIAALAGHAAMSVRNLTRVFQSETAVTPTEYVETARLDAARRLLEDTDVPLQRVASRCGFGNTDTMRRTFLRRIGTGPHDYRARFRT
jgi:transcriptional regulator GlxA family with amidase domain